MYSRERIIRDRFATHVCGICGTNFSPDGVLVLARRTAAWMVMATCATCQKRGIYIVTFHESQDELTIHPSPGDPPATQAFPSSSHNQPEQPQSSPLADPDLAPRSPRRGLVSAQDVDDMHDFLGSFNGDFRLLFAQQNRGRGSD